MSEATTRGIHVEVESTYEEERSNPRAGEYFFRYHVRISNQGEDVAQLLSRVWVITDGPGFLTATQKGLLAAIYATTDELTLVGLYEQFVATLPP